MKMKLSEVTRFDLKIEILLSELVNVAHDGKLLDSHHVLGKRPRLVAEDMFNLS